MKRLLIKNGILVTLDDENRVFQDHGLAVEGSRIKAIGPVSELERLPYDEVLDARGMVILPGFINTHMHFYSAFATGLGKAEPAHDFLEILERLWWRLDKKLTLEDCYYSALIGCIQSIKNGTTTIMDHHASPMAVRGSLAAVARAIREAGLRASLCYEVSDRDGPEIAGAGIQENVAFFESLGKGDEEDLRALFGLHASFTVSDQTLKRAVTAANRLGVGFHIHTAEDAADRKMCLERHNKTVVRRLHHAGILGTHTICAHCVHIDESEMDLLADTGTIVTHQPQSNMNNGVGVMDLPALAGRGVLVGLGTDAMTSNMLEELRSALWVRHLTQRDPGAGFQEVVHTLIRANPAIARRFWGDRVGILEEGGRADIVLFDYDPHTPLTGDSFAGHLVFGLPGSRVDTTIAGGRVLMRAGKLCVLDEERITAEARRLAHALWSRF